jgi:hypothetical protein
MASKVAALVLLALMLILLARRRWPWFPVGRSMGAACCAVLMVAVPEVNLLPANVLNEPGVIDVNTIAILFGSYLFVSL